MKNLVKQHHDRNGNDEAEVNRQKKENQAVLQLVLIVLSFLAGYGPMCCKNISLGEDGARWDTAN